MPDSAFEGDSAAVVLRDLLAALRDEYYVGLPIDLWRNHAVRELAWMTDKQRRIYDALVAAEGEEVQRG